MRNYKLALVVFLMLPTACSLNAHGISAYNFASHREDYIGKDVAVFGVLSIGDKGNFLCDIEESDLCLTLAIPKSLYDKARKMSSEKVSVQGIYLEHEFKSDDGKNILIPSRILVKSINIM